jgi:hypothetical protein
MRITIICLLYAYCFENFPEPFALDTSAKDIFGHEIKSVDNLICHMRFAHRSSFAYPLYQYLFLNVGGIYRLLNRRMSLEDVDLSQVTVINPLLLKLNLTAFEYRRCLLPVPKIEYFFYNFPEIPRITLGVELEMNHKSLMLPEISSWDSFEQEVVQWIGSNLDTQKEIEAKEPTLRKAEITCYISMWSCVVCNILEFAEQVLPDGIKFGNVGESDGPKHPRPDRVLLVDHKTVAAPVMVYLDLQGRDLNENLKDEKFLLGVNKVFTHMNMYKRKYGILSSYEFTWFLRRQFRNGKQYLEISRPISYAQSNPTLIESVVYFASTVTVEDFPSYTEPSFYTIIARAESSITMAPTVSGHRSLYGGSFSLNDFTLDQPRGTPHDYVYHDQFNGCPITLKVMDVPRVKMGLWDMEYEIGVYMKLESLQGLFIPRLVLYGQFQCLYYCFGLSVVGETVEVLTEMQKDYLIEGLHRIHKLHVVLNGIDFGNIIIDDQGRPYFIDFSCADAYAIKEDKDKEMKNFLKLIGRR